MAATISAEEMITLISNNGDNPVMVQKLLEENPELLSTPVTPVMLQKLCRENPALPAFDPTDMVKNGDSINGVILLHIVIVLNKPKILEMLIQTYQIDTSALFTDPQGRIFSALDVAVSLQHTDVIKILIPQSEIKGINNLLHSAVGSNQIEMVRLSLMSMPANSVDSRDGLGNTALCYALRNANQEIASLLLDAGADIRAAWENVSCPESPLHYAVSQKQREMVAFLIENGAEINAENWYHATPLEYAIQMEDRETAAMLVAAGADVHKIIRSHKYLPDQDWLMLLFKKQILRNMWKEDNDRIAELSNPNRTTFSANDKGKEEAAQDVGSPYRFFPQWLPFECMQDTLSLLDEASEKNKRQNSM